MGQSPPGKAVFEDQDEPSKSGLPFIQGNAEFGNLFPNPTKRCAKPLRVAQPGDFLMSVRAPVGATNRNRTTLCIGRGLAAIRFDKASRAYGWHAVNMAKKTLERYCQGSTFKAIRRHDLITLQVPLPPPDERQRIARILDSVDEAIERTDGVIGASEELRDSLLHHLLGGDRFQSVGTRHSPPADLPDGWRMVRLGDMASIRRKKITPKPSDCLPYIGLEHIAPHGRLLGHGRAGDTQSAKTVFKSGDTLFGKLRPNLRKTVRVSFAGVCSTDILALFPSDESTGGYLIALMSGPSVHNAALRSASGTRMPRTSWPFLRWLPVPLPPREEQQRIARILDSVDETIEQTRREQEALVELKQSMADALLSGRVRVRSA